jgi:hypothetical protein
MLLGVRQRLAHQAPIHLPTREIGALDIRRMRAYLGTGLVPQAIDHLDGHARHKITIMLFMLTYMTTVLYSPRLPVSNYLYSLSLARAIHAVLGRSSVTTGRSRSVIPMHRVTVFLRCPGIRYAARTQRCLCVWPKTNITYQIVKTSGLRLCSRLGALKSSRRSSCKGSILSRQQNKTCSVKYFSVLTSARSANAIS